jgi:hypothetical protein
MSGKLYEFLKLNNEFINDYPMTVKYLVDEMTELKEWDKKVICYLAINLSILIALFNRGDYDDRIKDLTNKKQPTDVACYLYCKKFNSTYIQINKIIKGSHIDMFETIKNIEEFKPKNFMTLMLSQTTAT